MVTVVIKDVTVRQIIAEWARGQAKVVNAERLPGGPISRTDQRAQGRC
jgi:hypothetical protein